MRRLKLTFMVVIMSISTFGFADNHAAASESAVLKALSAYMDARNTRDFKTVIAMSSKAGTLDTNSDGSFHKPLTKQTIEAGKRVVMRSRSTTIQRQLRLRMMWCMYGFIQKVWSETMKK